MDELSADFSEAAEKDKTRLGFQLFLAVSVDCPLRQCLYFGGTV